MTDLVLETFNLTFLFCLNPVAWVVIVLVSVRAAHYWITAVAGILAHLISITAFLAYIYIEDGLDFSKISSELRVDEVVLLISASILSGFVISALVVLFVKQRQLRQPI
jgi:hypothetical protein